METFHVILIVACILGILAVLGYLIYLEAPKHFDFCIGTYVNSKGEEKYAIGVKKHSQQCYYAVKDTIRNVGYNYTEEQINTVKSRFKHVPRLVDFKDRVYYNANFVTPVKEL